MLNVPETVLLLAMVLVGLLVLCVVFIALVALVRVWIEERRERKGEGE